MRLIHPKICKTLVNENASSKSHCHSRTGGLTSLTWLPHFLLFSEFQLLDADEVLKEADLGSLPFGLPLIRLFGCSRRGQSVLVVIRDFLPYFFFPVSPGFGDADLAAFLDHCRQKVPDVAVVSAEVVVRTPLMYFRPEAGDRYSHFLRITVALPRHVGILSKHLCAGKLAEAFGRDKFYDTQAYEANVNYLLRLMIDKDMAGGGWLTVPAGKYAALAAGTANSSRCHINVACRYEDLEVHPVSDNSKRWSSVAPLRILTLSAFVLLPSEAQVPAASKEPAAKKRKVAPVEKTKGKAKAKEGGGNDSASSDQENGSESEEASEREEGEQEPLAFIAAILNLSGKHVQVVFTYRPDFQEPEGTHLLLFDSERQMLLGWKEFFLRFDPDIITGYASVECMALIFERAAE